MPQSGSQFTTSIPPMRFRFFSLLNGKTVLLAGLGALVAWWRGLGFLTSVMPGLVAMKPITAVAFSITGVSLCSYHGTWSGSRTKTNFCRWLSAASACVVVVVGGVTLAEHIAGLSFGLDDLMFRATLLTTRAVNPGRMAPAAAFGFLLIGLALLSLNGETDNWRFRSQLLALATSLVGFVGFLSYLYGVPRRDDLGFYISMALHSSLLLAVAGLGVLFARPDSGLAAEITGDRFGALMARRLLPFVIVLTVTAGWVWQYGLRMGLYGPEFASALTEISGLVLVCFLVWQNAMRLNRLDQQRRQAEERDSWLAAIVNSSNDAIVGRTVEGTINSWNKAAERLFGYAEAEVLARSPNPFIPQDRQDELHELLVAARQGRTIEPHETVRIRKDGGSINVSLTQSPVTDSSGRIIGAAILVHDITEQKKGQVLLRESESRLRAVVHSAMDAVIMVNSSQDIVLFNIAAEKMFGYSEAEICGQPLSRLIPDRERATHAEHIRRFGQAGITSRRMGALSTVHGRRANGQVFPIEASISMCESEGQKLFSAIVRDVSERENTENELRLAQTQLLSALEAGSMGTWSWDIPTDSVAWTDPLLKVHEIAPGVLSDNRLRTFLSFVHAGDRPAVEKAFQTAVQAGAPYEIEYRIRRADGALQWIAARGRLERDAHGRPWRLTGVCMDITAHKRLADTVLQSQKMEALGTLAGGVAHDFNNILMAIGGNVELAIAELPAEHPAHQNLERIEKAGNRAASLVRQILTFSRQQPPVRGVISLVQEVEEAVKLLQATLPARIEIRAEYGPGVPSVAADPTQVHQILMNLGTNAAHAMGESSGVIDLRLEGVETSDAASGLPPGRYARVTFRDNGCGMDKATMARAFEPFFTTKGPGKGTGLGLSVVHGIMKNHGGTAIVHSEVGRGTTFQLFFPAAQHTPESAGTTRPAAKQVPRGNGERILCVDDEESVVLVTQSRLAQLGYRVTGCTDPCEARELFRSRPNEFDAIITDVSMPRLPGAELVRAAREVRPDIPVIMTSGYLRSEDYEAAEHLEVRELITKPSDFGELARALQRIFAMELSGKES